MVKPEAEFEEAEFVQDDPQAMLERLLLEEYLQSKGYSMSELDQLPEEEAHSLMKEATKSVSLKLAQFESAAHFREEIRRPSASS